MRNITGQAVTGENLYGRSRELADLWEKLEQGEHVLMLAPRRVGKTSLMQELQRDPRERWAVIYVEVEGCDGAADCVAAILAAVAADPQHRSRFDAIPFSNAVKGVVQRLQSVSLDVSARFASSDVSKIGSPDLAVLPIWIITRSVSGLHSIRESTRWRATSSAASAGGKPAQDSRT